MQIYSNSSQNQRYNPHIRYSSSILIRKKSKVLLAKNYLKS
jgi:hypothetical protein